MPIGMSRFGFFASSAVVDTASNPIYAKKTMEAPVRMPRKPFGANGCQCSGRTYLKLTKTKKPRTTSLMATIQKLKLADSRTPHTSTIVTSVTMPTESLSRLSEPGLVGDWESADSPLEGVTSGEMFGLTLGPKGAAKLHSRNSLEIENVTGQWRVAGSKLILRFSEGGSVRSVEMAAELADADRLRLTVGGKTAEFQRKKN